ncbi:hypothetical protein ACS0TY_033761 [Phlomoides rotata]
MSLVTDEIRAYALEMYHGPWRRNLTGKDQIPAHGDELTQQPSAIERHREMWVGERDRICLAETEEEVRIKKLTGVKANEILM